MPFHQRTVEPARLHRPEAARAGAAGAPLFRSLEQVSSHALVCLLEQLADLSRCAGDIFGELEGQAAALGRRTAALHRRLDDLHAAAARLDHRRVKIPVSNLDEESRWTVHYTAPWHQQENVFLPASRPPCVEDLHRQAKLNLKSVLRECDKLRRDGYRSSQYYSQGPTFASSGPPSDEYQDEDDETDQKGSISSSEEERHISIRRPKTPTSSDFPDLNTQTNWAKSLPLPTPEEKMRLHAQTVQADVVPINITGESFHRQASLRQSLIYTDTLVRRPKKVKRRKTITGVPDNIQKELASGSGQDGVGGPSVYAPDHCSTLGRHGGCWSAGPRSETRDSGCQTEEVKVVPPSMRRIRAQKGLGIAAQMGHFSGSSGNMSVLSDSAGVVLPSRLNADAGFHSLPRSGARASLQPLGPRPGAPGPAQDLDGTLETLGHLAGASRTGTLFRPKSQELRPLESGSRAGPACVVSPHGTYTTSVIPNATLSSSSEVIVIHPAQSLGQLDSQATSSASHAKVMPRDRLLSRHPGEGDGPSPSATWAEGPSTLLSPAFDPHPPRAATLLAFCDSAVALHTPASQENGSQAAAYTCRRNPNVPAHPQDAEGKSEPSYSGGGEPWEYSASGSGQASPPKPHLATPGCSAPGSHTGSCSLDHTCHQEGARSLYSGGHDGYYAPVHPDAGRGPGNPGGVGGGGGGGSSNGFGNPRHSVINVFDGRAQKNQGDGPHSRNISLKKAKKPPLPPSRTDSLHRVPKKNAPANGQVLNESLIASLQHSLQLSLRGPAGLSPSQSPCSDLEEPWLPRSRSQSTVSGGSSLASAATAPHGCAPGGATPSQSDTSSVRSEYADPWGYYIDYTGLQEDPAHPGGGCPAGGGAPAGNGPLPPVQVQEDGCRAPHVPGGPVKPKVTSPEKPHRVTSPSSGYSSQSNTPTALTPVPVFLKPMSPANGKPKPKPKVPERKSSLVSSVSISSSSTSLSSNTSTEGGGTVRRLDPAPASGPSMPSSPGPADQSPVLPPPPPLAGSPEGPPLPRSPLFPPPPPEVLAPSCSPPDACFSPPRTARSPPLDPPAPGLPPPPSLASSAPPPAPPLDPKWMKDARPSFKKSSQPASPQEAPGPPGAREEGGRPPLPLITTEALQTVQLRPVRRNSGAPGALPSEQASQEKRTPLVPQYHLKPSALLKSRNSINEMESESQPACVTSRLPAAAKTASQGHRDGAAERGRPSRSPGSAGEAEAGPGPGAAPPQRAPGPSPSKKPPPVSKKPKLFLVVPPPLRDSTAEPAENVSGAGPSPTRGEANESGAAPAGSDETDSGSSVLEGGAAGSTSPGRREANVPIMVQPGASPAPKQEEPGAENSVDRGGHAEESCPALQDPGPRVPETDAAGSSPEVLDFLKEEGSDEVMTPSRPRTTEDLFAAIHRSKRKVLGRKDSEDDHTRNHSPSPPVTPTGAAPSLASPKQVGSIQRSVRKSSTSSDNFKALLLKKGSRSDTSARMSAAEMLKNTDPRFQRSRSEPAPDAPDSPSSCSPSKNRRAQEEWARNEGLMPRSLSFSGPRYGRSRTPPSAASSRYSLRNRIQSSPMTVISEGEGEATEPVDTRARRVLGAARGCSLDGLVGDDIVGDSLQCDPADGTTSAQGRGPPEQCGGPLREAS